MAERIIPARAGFTGRWPAARPRGQDHPRSRGVYTNGKARPPCGRGSSPLARGLRGRGQRRAVGERIIPARAGFTELDRVWNILRGDHPRSRGVYPGAPGRSSGCLRIIPARAGFTPRLGGIAPGTLDHPRSRGVYAGRPVAVRAIRGSSPLARGLRAPRDLRRGRVRIIPARAGFTRHPFRLGGGRRDHPRSRGVYDILTEETEPEEGSSPLARGLPAGGPRSGPGPGIIPARAGFTDAYVDARRVTGDHPRSRGVYPGSPLASRLRRGSSPLARGLHPVLPHEVADAGIIPARAGFTTRSTSRPRTETDHPRSRGVYSPPTTSSVRATGSSPLARGLLGTPSRAILGYGIIPARAGFTDRLARRWRPPRDHPRSRGVYPVWGRIVRSARGSSPLARGLLQYRTPVSFITWIIPARAGFTPHVPSFGHPKLDHPRSRGVYPTPWMRTVTGPGSSPLARGLHRSTASHSSRSGIIPARAGFTPEPHSPR